MNYRYRGRMNRYQRTALRKIKTIWQNTPDKLTDLMDAFRGASKAAKEFSKILNEIE